VRTLDSEATSTIHGRKFCNNLGQGVLARKQGTLIRYAHFGDIATVLLDTLKRLLRLSCVSSHLISRVFPSFCIRSASFCDPGLCSRETGAVS
jgi:hypothetical protein